MPFTHVHKKRLRALAKKLRSLTPKEQRHFDMTRWFAHDNTKKHSHPLSNRRSNDPVRVATKDMLHCGTAGCAVGWAATMPMFQKLGLRMDWDASYEDGYPVLWRRQGNKVAGSIRVVRQLFGLTSQTASWLVSQYSPDESADEVADRIDELIDANGRIPLRYRPG